MTIRITSQMTSGLMNTTLNKNLSGIYSVYEQISTGKKLTSVGQSPIEGTKVMKYNTQLGQLGDWSKNIATAKEELSMSYDTLGLVNENLQRINELALQAANSTNSDESIEAIRDEINSRIKTIEQLSNTKYQDKYIFSGSNTTTRPYTLDDDFNVTYEGTPQDGDWERNVEISKDTTIALNVNGQEIFGDENSGLFATLKNLTDSLNTADFDPLEVSACLTPLQNEIKNVTAAQATMSNRVQRLDATSAINSDFTLNLTEGKSSIEDTDLIQAASELARYQMALQASLQAGATIMQQVSLLNYI